VSLIATICVGPYSRHLDDIAEVRTPPDPGVVRDHVGRVGDERSIVCVELAHLVRRSVVVRVTDR